MFRTLALALSLCFGAASAQEAEPAWSVVIHGGAGVIERGDMDAATEAAYRAALNDAAVAAGEILDAGGSAMDAVETVIRAMEDDP